MNALLLLVGMYIQQREVSFTRLEWHLSVFSRIIGKQRNSEYVKLHNSHHGIDTNTLYNILHYTYEQKATLYRLSLQEISMPNLVFYFSNVLLTFLLYPEKCASISVVAY